MEVFEKLRRLDFQLQNKVWREVSNVATGDTHFPTLAIDILSDFILEGFRTLFYDYWKMSESVRQPSCRLTMFKCLAYI